MRHARFVCLLCCLTAPALGQYGDYTSGGGYSIERWQEDYSYLKDPAARTDPFDPLKFIPLDSNDDWYLSTGGQVRDRYDYFHHGNFGSGYQDYNGFDLVRILAHVDAHFGPDFRVFFQVNSGMIFDRDGGPRPGDADDVDVQQAFADLTVPINDRDSVVFRLGRQELIYGAQRLVSPNDWGNVRRTFEGAKASIYFPDDALDVFLVRPVIINKTRFNSGDDHTAFGGIYNVTEFPRMFPNMQAKLDTYLFWLGQSASTTTAVAVPSDTFTLGVRPHANPAPWDFDVEADWQFGRDNGRAIGAWGVAGELGYTFANVKFEPNASIGLDIASGSPDPAHRFNQLFPPLYLYLGHAYLLGRENIIDLHEQGLFNLRDDLTMTLAYHWFWRQNNDDAIYEVGGAVQRPTDGSNARTIGSELDLAFNWQIQQHLSAYAGYAHFFSGPFIRQTGPGGDVDFIYAAMTFTF